MAGLNKKIKVYDIGSMLGSKGWFMGSGQGTPTLSCTITDTNHDLMPDLIENLRECANEY